MKTLLRTRSIWILVIAPILAAVLLIFGYSAIATARRAATVSDRSDVAQAPLQEGKLEQVQKRREYLNRFYGTGPGQVPHANFAASLATARALPPSPLLRNKSVVSGSEQNWTYPIPPPMSVYDGTASVRIDAIAVDPGDENTVYVGSEGGLARTTNGGTTWSIRSDGFLSQSIRSIAIDPSDTDIVYAGTGTNQYFGVGIYRSDDGGENWDLISGPVESSPFSAGVVAKIVVDPNTAGSTTTTTLYASFIQSGKHSIWRSTDSGENWTEFRNVEGGGDGPFCFYDIAINPDDPSQVYITAPDGVFMKDAWGTKDWLQLHDKLPNPGDPSCLVFAYTNPWALLAELFLAYQQGDDIKIVKSSPPSSTWADVGDPIGGQLFSLGIDPAHPNRIFLCVFGQLQYSMDGGSTWLSSGGGVHLDIHSIAFCPTDPEMHYLGTDGGIYRADYPTASPPPHIIWTPKNQTLAGILTLGVSISRDDHLFIGTQDNGYQLSRPENPPWALVSAYDPQLGILLGGDGWIPFIEAENNIKRIYAVTYTPGNRVINAGNGFPCRIIDAEVDSVTPPGGIGEYSIVFPTMSVEFKCELDSDRVIMGFQHVWRSEDSGNSWTRIGGIACPTPSPTPGPSWSCGLDPGLTITAVYEAPGNSNFIYAITGDEINGGTKVFMTSQATDKGPDAEWVNITGNLPAGGLNAIAVHPTDPLIVYLASSSHVYMTSDPGSATWEIDDPGADFIYRDVKFHPEDPNTVLVASHRGVFARVDHEWGSLNANLPAGMAIVNISFNKYSHQLAAATYGRGVYVLDLDREPPTVSITPPPVNDAEVSGTIVLVAAADDNHRVAGVQFTLGGNELGVEDTAVPFSIEWDTTLTENGDYRLKAWARDAYGNITESEAVAVKVAN